MPSRPILLGGLAAGILDAIDALATFVPRGVSPLRIGQAIASGLLGRGAFQGGAATALLGLFLHFVIATGAALLYYLLGRNIPGMTRRPWLAGPLFGVFFYLLMNYVVLPLSAYTSPRGPFDLANFLHGAIGHALLVGLPIALILRRHEK